LISAYPSCILRIAIEGRAMITKVRKWGNSQGLRLARRVLEDARIAIDEPVEVEVRDGVVVITPLRRVRGRYRLDDLLAKIPRGHRGREIDWGRPVGKEVW
jgi:antitoxin MazE